jgi:hypothetical protein
VRVLLRRVLVVLAVAAPVAAGYVSYRWPWVWYGSRNGYYRHRMRTFALPPDFVVHEEDPGRAAALRARPPNPAMGDADYPGAIEYWDGNWRGRPYAWHCPPFFVDWNMPRVNKALLFMHGRVAPGGRRYIVWVHGGRPRRARDAPGVWLAAMGHADDGAFWPYQADRRGLLNIPVPPDARVRFFAGQPDPNDNARFTIRYHVDNVPGTIEGRLGVDGTVTLRVLNGPAATGGGSCESTR